MVNVTLDIIGIDCILYIPTSTALNTAEKLDVWSHHTDLAYLSYTTMVYIEWKPKITRLRKLGLFKKDGALPIIARFGNTATPLTGSQVGTEIEVDIHKQSYFTIAPEFIPNDYVGVEEFEVVDIAIDAFHDAALKKVYSIAPRRVKR
jgi:hypothetical protein